MYVKAVMQLDSQGHKNQPCQALSIVWFQSAGFVCGDGKMCSLVQIDQSVYLDEVSLCIFQENSTNLIKLV